MARGKTVAVIGAGPAGLVAAKSMLEVGILPTVFDKLPRIGGIWNPKSKRCWDSLRTNNSRHLVYFSDFPRDQELFPGPIPLNLTQLQLFEYLDTYARKFLLPEHFSLSCEVTSVSRRNEDGKYVLQWSSNDDEQKHEGEFDFVMFASGVYGTPYIPTNLPGLDGFKGDVLHSSQYHNAEKFAGKKVVVVGTSFSAGEVAAEIALGGGDVVNIGRRRVWVLPRCIAIDPVSAAPSFLPIESVFLTYSKAALVPQTTPEQRSMMMHGFLRSVCGDQGPLSPDPKHDNEPVYMTISDTYMELVRSRRIDMRIGQVREVQGRDLIMDDDSVINDVDCIIFCTGYRTAIPYFSKEVLEEIEYDPTDGSLPMLLDRGTFHPSLPGTAFLGCYGGPSMVIMELQARWAAGVFSGALPAVPESVQREGIAAERRVREQTPHPQFAHEDHIGFTAAIAAELNIWPSPEFRAANDFQIPAHFRQGATCEAAVADFNRELKELLDGKMVPYAVFRSLAGNWTFQRRIENRTDPAQSGTATGTASFTATGPAATEYLYSEAGGMVLSGGVKCQVSRKYFYVFDIVANRIDVFFENQGARGALFHSLHFLPRESSTDAAADANEASRESASSHEKGWRAEGRHLSVKDVYSPSYLFQFRGNCITTLEISHAVDGPQKKHTSTATYVR